MDDDDGGRRYSNTGRKRSGYSRTGRRAAPRTGPGSGPEPRQWILATVAVNVAVFVLWHLTVDNPVHAILRAQLLVSRAEVATHPWTLLTYAFTHYDTAHMLFNMFALWIFGTPVLAKYGWRLVVPLYLVGALGGSLAHVAMSQNPALGASAAVMAVSLVFGLSFPKRKLLLWFFVPVPALVAVLAFVALDVMGAIGPGDGVAHAAHLGGAAVGAAFWVWRNPKALRR